MKISLFVLTLNEIDGVKIIMPQIDRELFEQILIVDGGSNDGTIEWAKDNGFEVYVQQKLGFRHAYFEAWPLVRGDHVITFSPDGNSVPQVLGSIIEKLNAGNEMVIASRYLADATSEDDDLITAFGNWFFTKTINLLHSGKYTDAMVIYRGFPRDLPVKLELLEDKPYRIPELLFRTNISWEPLMSVRAARAGLRVVEVPGDEPARIGGERKLKIFKWGAAYYFQFLADFLTNWKIKIK